MGKLYVVGFGPGGYEHMTAKCIDVINNADIITGYTTYVEMLKEFFPDKNYLATPMMQEVKRCRMAVEEAMKDQTVAMVSSGDSGIYGMAGIIYQVAEEMNADIEIETVPGVTAASAAASVLGAPLMHDFAVISLSDLLTPWETIETRLDAAVKADFSICLYNPSSKKRADYLKRACEIFLRYKSPETVCGIVKNIGRDGEMKKVMTLAELKDYEADMFTTVFIGNSRTEKSVLGGQDWMVTPRGYRI